MVLFSLTMSHSIRRSLLKAAGGCCWSLVNLQRVYSGTTGIFSLSVHHQNRKQAVYGNLIIDWKVSDNLSRRTSRFIVSSVSLKSGSILLLLNIIYCSVAKNWAISVLKYRLSNSHLELAQFPPVISAAQLSINSNRHITKSSVT